VAPIETVADLAGQSAIQYGTLHAGSTMSFFRVSKKILQFLAISDFELVEYVSSDMTNIMALILTSSLFVS
jgi:hypothetical protein